jgi:uncharacterized protein YmfQ (DUF2313 family)
MIHADLLKALLPVGAFDLKGVALAAELAAEGQALDRALSVAEQLLSEADPRTTAAMLADWERVYGLPDPLITAAGTVQSFQERRLALVVKVTLQGGQSKAFFIALASALGYVITITESVPHSTEFDSQDAVSDDQYRYLWYVNAALNSVRDLTAEDDTEMATAVWGNALLEAVIKGYKPAHTFVLFAYT